MRKITLVPCLLLCCASLVLPAWSSDGSADEHGKPSKKSSGRRAKEAKDGGQSSGGADGSLDSQLDKILGQPTAKDVKPTDVPDLSGGSSASQAPDGSPAQASDSAPAQGPDSSPPKAPDSSAAQAPESSADDGIIEEGKIPPNTLKAGELNNQAVAALSRKDFAQAIDLLKQAVAVDSSYTQGKRNLCIAYFDNAVELYNDGKFAEALPLLQKALEIAKQTGQDAAQIKQLESDCRQAMQPPAKK